MNTKQNKTWGGRFEKAQDPKVIAFNASIAIDYVLFPYDIEGSQAHACMLAKQGLLQESEASEICRALSEIGEELAQGLHVFDNTYEDIHMFIEHLLIQKIGDSGKKLHTGRSRNDQVALDLRLYARDKGQQLKEQLQQLEETLRHLSDKHQEQKMPGYTHLQQAQPIRLGQYFSAYQSMFQRDLGRLQDWHERMNVSPLGAGALAGSNLPLNREFVAQKLGFSGVIANTIDAVSDRDFIIEFCSLASIIMMHLSRLAEDLIIFATQEFGFVLLDDAFATGSSLMPNKKNPDVLELIRGKSARVFGHLLGMLTLMKGLPMAYNKDLQEDKTPLFDSVATLSACLGIIVPFLESLRFNSTHMHNQANSGYMNATALLESLVLQGMPFRDAHHLVGQKVTEALLKNISLSDIMDSKPCSGKADE